jgi:hypothetical protein
MKTSLRIIIILAFVIAFFFLQFGCTKEENITQVVSLTNPLQGTWQAKSIRLIEEPAAPAGYSRPDWQTFLINSGILTNFGTATLNFSERDFNGSASLSPTLPILSSNRRDGSVSGRYIIYLPQNYITIELRTWTPQNLFVSSGRDDYPSFIGDFSISGNELTLNFYRPRNWWTYDPDLNYFRYYEWNEKYTIVLTKLQ